MLRALNMRLGENLRQTAWGPHGSRLRYWWGPYASRNGCVWRGPTGQNSDCAVKMRSSSRAVSTSSKEELLTAPSRNSEEHDDLRSRQQVPLKVGGSKQKSCLCGTA